MTRPKGTGGKAKSLTRDEIARLRRSLKTTTHERRNRALIDLALGTGMRIGEIVSLVVKDVWDAQRHESLEEIVLERHSTKSGKSRTVAVAPFARYSIQQYLDERQQTGILYINMLLFPSYHSIHQPKTPNGAVNVVRAPNGRGPAHHTNSSWPFELGNDREVFRRRSGRNPQRNQQVRGLAKS